MKHALAVAVAVAYVVVALPDGSYAPEAIAAGTLVIWWAVIVGLAVGAWPRTGVPRPAIAAGACLAALALLTAISLAWASDDGRAFVEVVRVVGYVGVFVLVVLASPRGSARSWLVGLALGLAAVAALALGSRFQPGFLGAGEEIASSIPSARGRLSFPIGYWNGLGACMALGGVLLVWLGARAETRLARSLAVGWLPPLLLTVYLTSSRGGAIAAGIGVAVLLALGPSRLQLAAGLALGAVGGGALIALAEQRSSFVDDPGSFAAGSAGEEMLLAAVILAAATGLARYLLDERLSRLRVGRRMPKPAIALAVLAVIAVGIAADPVARLDEFREPTGARVDLTRKEIEDESGPGARSFAVSGDLTRGASSGRYQFWSVAMDAFASEPVTGIGAGGYEAWWGEHGTLALVVSNAHSLFFELLAELGVAGLLLIASFLVLGGVHGWRRRHGGSAGGTVEAALALLAAGTVSAAIDWTWELPAVFGPVVVAVAVLTGAATLRPGDPALGRRSFGWGVATLMAGWAAVWVAGILFLGELKLSDSEAGADRGDLAGAAQDARDASTLQPWAAEPHLQLALVDEQAGDLAHARRELDKALELAPDDWSLWFVGSRIEEAAGNLEVALAYYGRARKLNPRTPAFRRR